MLNRHRVAPFSPSDISGLSLWLKADTGVTTQAEQFISQIVISGAGTTTSDGTYTRASGGNTQFNGPNGNYIYNTGGSEWALFDTQLYNINNEDYGYDSYYTEDFANWYISGANLGESPAPSGTITNIPTGITFVTAWSDQSGNTNNASPVDAPPVFNASDLNGKPTISLSSIAVGQNQSLQISGNPMGAVGSTAFVVNYVDPNVFSVDNEGGDANGALLGNFGNASDGSHWPYGFTNSVYDSFATDTRKDDLGLPSGITSWNIYSVYSQDNDWKIFCNGAEFYSDEANVYSNGIANSTSLYIGMQNNAGTEQIFKGKVAEVVIYNRVLTTPELEQVEAYLNAKYAIY